MNTQLFKTNLSQPIFMARKSSKQTAPQKDLGVDIVELSKKQETLPHKIELTEFEKTYDKKFQDLQLIKMNIRTQKQMLREFYSSQDKYEYKELLKEQRRVIEQLKRLAGNSDYLDLGFDIMAKREYNRYAPKIERAQSLTSLNEVFKTLKSTALFSRARNLLYKLIEQKYNGIK